MAKVMARKTSASLHRSPEVARRQGTNARAKARVPVRKIVFRRSQRLGSVIPLTPKLNSILPQVCNRRARSACLGHLSLSPGASRAMVMDSLHAMNAPAPEGGVPMKIIVTDEVTGEGLALLRADPRIHLDIRLGLSKEALLSCIGEYDAIITRSGTTVVKALLDAAIDLKIVARAGVGIDNVDVDYASPRGVIVVNAPFGNTNSAAEHTLALLLAACRNVTVANN